MGRAQNGRGRKQLPGQLFERTRESSRQDSGYNEIQRRSRTGECRLGSFCVRIKKLSVVLLFPYFFAPEKPYFRLYWIWYPAALAFFAHLTVAFLDALFFSVGKTRTEISGSMPDKRLRIRGDLRPSPVPVS